MKNLITAIIILISLIIVKTSNAGEQLLNLLANPNTVPNIGQMKTENEWQLIKKICTEVKRHAGYIIQYRQRGIPASYLFKNYVSNCPEKDEFYKHIIISAYQIDPEVLEVLGSNEVITFGMMWEDTCYKEFLK